MDTNNEMTYKADIVATRVGGLGSSDAKMVAQIGRTGVINYAAQERIGQMLGQVERKQIKTKAMELGDNMENTIFAFLKQRCPDAESNPKVMDEELSAEYGFDIFTHIDYAVEDERAITWFECKATKDDVTVTRDKYKEQLAWHYAIGKLRAEKSGKLFNLFLVHYNTNDFSGEFDVTKMDMVKIHEPAQMLVDDITEGLVSIKAAIASGFVFVPKEELDASDLPAEQQERMAIVCGYVRALTEAEKKLAEFKELMLPIMRENNVKSIKNDMFSIFYRGEGTRTSFDTKRFERDHPELYREYCKTSKVKDSITIKIND